MSNSEPFPEDLDLAYREAESQTTELVPEGTYQVRVASATATRAKTGSPGLRVEFVILESREKGCLISQDFWLVGGALPRTKGALEKLGFSGLSPNQVASFRNFSELPSVRVRVAYREFQGQRRSEITVVGEESTTERSV